MVTTSHCSFFSLTFPWLFHYFPWLFVRPFLGFRQSHELSSTRILIVSYSFIGIENSICSHCFLLAFFFFFLHCYEIFYEKNCVVEEAIQYRYLKGEIHALLTHFLIFLPYFITLSRWLWYVNLMNKTLFALTSNLRTTTAKHHSH